MSYGMLVGSEALLILSRDEAMRWCEEKAPADIFEAEFGIEDDELTRAFKPGAFSHFL